MNETTLVLTAGLGTVVLVIPALRFVMHVDRRLRARGWALMAGGYAMQTLPSVWAGETEPAAIDAALTAFFLWQWWNNGGGDGMRRIWKRAKARLTMPRLAPQAA
jgi:hypothetical protein